ncbi:MAG: hypothetical protein J5616_05195 [Bacteroidaceae bacterium]|nr:hypothetical protein [Bacteroidaceae bacterium]
MNKLTFAIIATTFVTALHAQNGINSPYSRYGFGIQSERAMGFNKGMGGVAQGFRNGQQINIANPASYSAVDSVTALFDIGISLQNSNHKMGNLQQNIRNTSFDYFAFQFRAFRHVGMTIGLMPITNIKYEFASTSENLEGTENITSSYSFNGDGGLREVIFGTGWNPFKPISIGFNVSYIWGDYTHNMQMAFSENSAFGLKRTYSADISTYNVQAGLQFIQPINKKDKIVLGGTYTLGHNMGNEAYRTTESVASDATGTQTSDTVKNAFHWPTSIAAGITYYHSNTLRIGADFELQRWSGARFPNQQTGLSGSSLSDTYTSTTGQLNDRFKIASGLDWTPNPLSSHYFSKCTYKVGGYYSQSYAKADVTGVVTQKPYEVGVSAGISLPIANAHVTSLDMRKRNIPRINMSVQWVHTNIPYLNASTMQPGKLIENYFKFCLGISFSERWFYKSKLD